MIRRLWSRHDLPLLGLVYLVVLALLIGASVLTYRKDLPWQRTVDVRLVTDRPGLELNPGSDVKLQGRLVGRVDRIESDGTTATIHLALDPDDAELVPADVDAAIVPKTLFGEKYVDLLAPALVDGAATIADGAVITQSTTATELGDIYATLVPLLRAIEPAQLSTVLSTLARTLDGKGEQLGRTISQSSDFLAELNPRLDVVQRDLVDLTRTLEIYDGAAPDLLGTLADVAGISRELLVPSEERLADLLQTLVTTSDQTTDVVDENSEAIIRLTGRVRPLLALLATYSGSLACSLDGLHTLDKLGNQVSGARGPFTLLNVDLLLQGDPYVYPRDLPSNPGSEANNANLPDIVPSWRPHCPRFGRLTRQVKDAAPFSLLPLPFQVIQTPGGEQGRVTDPRLADALGDLLTGGGSPTREPSRGPGLAGLLLGPMLYDGEVRIP